jgi:hypothetical protein
MKNLIAFVNGSKLPLPISFGGNEPIPNIPGNLISDSTEPYNSNIQWDPSNGRPWGYKIKIDDVEYTATPETEIEILGLGGGNEYDFYVKAFNGFGESDWANINQLTIPEATENIEKYFINNIMHIEWSAVNGASSYKIYSDSQLLGTTSNLTIDIDGRNYNSLSIIYVVAVNDSGDSTLCKIIKTNWNRPNPPLQLKIKSFTPTSIEIEWADMGVPYYKIYLNEDGPIQVNTNSAELVLVEGTFNEIKVTSLDSNYESFYSLSLFVYSHSSPTNLVASNTTKNSMDISWDEDLNVDSYSVYLNGNLYAYKITDLGISISDLLPDEFYTVEVNSNKNDSETLKSFITVSTLMEAPLNVEVSEIGNDYLILGWDPLKTATHYKVALNDSWYPDEIENNYYTITNLIGNTDYLLKVKGVNLSGEGDDSINISITTSLNNITGFTVDVSDDGIDNFVEFNWDVVSGATKYILKIIYDGITDTYETENNTYALENLDRNKFYNVMITATNNSESSSSFSEYKEFTIYGTPTNLDVRGVSSTNILLSWNSPTNVYRYEINYNGSVAYSDDVGYELTVDLNTEYVIKVRSINLSGDVYSPWSNIVTTKTLKLLGDDEIILYDDGEYRYLVWGEENNSYKYDITIDSTEYFTDGSPRLIFDVNKYGEYQIDEYYEDNGNKIIVRSVIDILPQSKPTLFSIQSAVPYENDILCSVSSTYSNYNVRWYLNQKLYSETSHSVSPATYYYENLLQGGIEYEVGISVKESTSDSNWSEIKTQLVTTNPRFINLEIKQNPTHQGYVEATWETEGYNLDTGFQTSLGYVYGTNTILRDNAYLSEIFTTKNFYVRFVDPGNPKTPGWFSTNSISQYIYVKGANKNYELDVVEATRKYVHIAVDPILQNTYTFDIFINGIKKDSDVAIYSGKFFIYNLPPGEYFIEIMCKPITSEYDLGYVSIYEGTVIVPNEYTNNFI